MFEQSQIQEYKEVKFIPLHLVRSGAVWIERRTNRVLPGKGDYSERLRADDSLCLVTLEVTRVSPQDPISQRDRRANKFYSMTAATSPLSWLSNPPWILRTVALWPHRNACQQLAVGPYLLRKESGPQSWLRLRLLPQFWGLHLEIRSELVIQP